MSLAWQLARAGIVVGVLGTIFQLFPDAPAELDELTIPDIVWNPIVAVLSLDRYFPVHETLVIAGVAIAIRAAMVGAWLWSWLIRHVVSGG